MKSPRWRNMAAPENPYLSKTNQNFLNSGKTMDQYFMDKKREESRLGGSMTNDPQPQSKGETKEEYLKRKALYEANVVTAEIPRIPDIGAQLGANYVPDRFNLDWRDIAKRFAQQGAGRVATV